MEKGDYLEKRLKAEILDSNSVKGRTPAL